MLIHIILVLYYYEHRSWFRIAQSVERLATGWTVWGSNLGGDRFLAPVQTSPGAHPASNNMGTESFSGEKRPGRDVEQPPHLAPG
jgi:hypothetical protein